MWLNPISNTVNTTRHAALWSLTCRDWGWGGGGGNQQHARPAAQCLNEVQNSSHVLDFDRESTLRSHTLGLSFFLRPL